MAKTDVTAVGAAFEMLLEEIEGVVGDINVTGARAFEQGKHDEAGAILEQARVITAFRQKVVSLRHEWDGLYSEQSEEVKEKVSRSNLGKAKKGMRTREEEYYFPILRTLADMGGRGEIGPVLDKVHQIMKGVLKPVDEEPLKSEPHTPRWRNAAQWARNSMVNDGLLEADSPRGVWEISEAGREYLAEHVSRNSSW